MKVRVLGEPSSGTHLAVEVLNASPDIEAWHDFMHGMTEWADHFDAVVLVSRYPLARYLSAVARDIHFGIPYPALVDAFPDSLIVHYEDLVKDVDAMIVVLADHFDIELWTYPGEIIDGNKKWL